MLASLRFLQSTIFECNAACFVFKGQSRWLIALAAGCFLLNGGISFSQVATDLGEKPFTMPPAFEEPRLPDLPDGEMPKTDDVQPEAEIFLPETSDLVPHVEINGVRQGGRKWKIIPHATVRAGFDDNIFITPDHKEADAFFVVAPGLSIGWGDFRRELKEFANFQQRYDLELEEQDEIFDNRRYFFANYTPSATIFANHSSEDSLDHDFSLAAQWLFTKLTLGFHSRIQSLSGSDIDVGRRAKRVISNGAITSRYELSDKTSFEVNFAGTHFAYRSGIDSTEIKNQNWFNYQIYPKTNLSLGLALGELEVAKSPSQTFEQGLVRGIYAATGKLYLNADVGVEFRQVADGGKGQVTPVFGLGVVYTPFASTLISVSAFRKTENSAGTAGDNILLTGIQARIRQRFLHRLYLTIAGSYEKSSYKPFSRLTEGSQNGITSPSRNDNTFSLRSSLAIDISKWASMEIAYEFRQNDSSLSELGFAENQASIQMSFIY